MTYRAAMLAAGRKYWADMLVKHGNNVSAAAREAGVHRQDVYKYLKRYSIPFRKPHKGAWDRGPAIPSARREMRL